jgi:adenylate kinase
MNLINKELQAPYEPGVYILTGVNGIGKSTIVDGIASEHPETVALHASLELSKLFNGISREEMELLKPEDKLAKMVVHFTAEFESAIGENKAVLLDTHLLIPIRKNSSVIYEDIWSDAYAPYATSMVMLSASPRDIRAWRMRDESVTGRRRNTDMADIASDQNQNIARFHSLKISGSIPQASRVVNNNHGTVATTRAEIESIFQAGSIVDN